MRCLYAAVIIAITSCHMSGDGDFRESSEAPSQRAILSIGELTTDTSLFVNSTCDDDGLGDCGAQDAQGRDYTIFEGEITRITLKRQDAKGGALLPAGMVFGEDIERSRRKASSHYRVALECGEVEGRRVCSSGFSIQSPTGTMYSLALVADEKGALEEVVERVNF